MDHCRSGDRREDARLTIIFNGSSTPCWRRVALPLVACLALGACETRTNVSATANVPAQYSHAYITAQAIWFNANAAAGPTDAGWQKLPLSTTSTFDLVTLTQGNLAQFATTLQLPIGTYNQVRLLLTDSAAALTTSAQALGAVYNDEVDYVDSSGTLHQLPLQVPNAAQGIAIPISLH